jgi:predicted amidohydrolase YtcJ
MNKKNKLLGALLALSAFASLAKSQGDYQIIHNVTGYTPTMSGDIATFTHLVTKDGKVIAYGDAALTERFSPANKIDGNGLTMLPGLIDAHGHMMNLGRNLSRLDVRSLHSKEAIGEALAAFAKDKDGWILGRGWDQEKWPVAEFPSAADLDKYESERPVMLTRVDGHAVWLNTKAMQLIGLTRESQAPAGGEIIKLESGEPSGVLIDNAEQLATPFIPANSQAQLEQYLALAGEHLLSLGITSVHDAGIDSDTYQVYVNKAANMQLPIRLYAMLSATDSNLMSLYKRGKILDKHDFLAIRSIKVYADGALGSRGAALLADYHDRPHHQGLMLVSNDELFDTFTTAIKHGFSVNTHAIGDKANRVVLDTYQKAYKKVGGHLLRNRIEHAQIVDPEDIPRFKQLSIIPSMQPVHATSDMYMAEKRLGDNRLKGAYAWQSFLAQGSKVAAGSDFPVELANPFFGLYAAISRQDLQGLPEGGWLTEEKLTREQALRAFTLDAAYAAHQEFKLGSLEQGKWADFILIDKDYFKAPLNELANIKVQQTWLAGHLVYQAKP